METQQRIVDLVTGALHLWAAGDMETAVAEIRGIFHGFAACSGLHKDDAELLAKELCVSLAASWQDCDELVEDFAARLCEGTLGDDRGPTPQFAMN